MLTCDSGAPMTRMCLRMARTCTVMLAASLFLGRPALDVPAQESSAEQENIVHTYSIVAHDPELKEWGVAVASKFLAVGAVVPWAKAGVGAIATQSAANTSYGPRG